MLVHVPMQLAHTCLQDALLVVNGDDDLDGGRRGREPEEGWGRDW